MTKSKLPRTYEEWYSLPSVPFGEDPTEYAWKAGYKAALLDALDAMDTGECDCLRNHVKHRCVHDFEGFFKGEVEGLMPDD